MRNRWLRLALCLSAAFLLLCSAGRAVTVITSGKQSTDGSRLSAAKAAIRERTLGSYGMVPIRAGDIADGVYEVQVTSTSPFFKIVSARLTVTGEDMCADIRLGSESYTHVYMGDMAQADGADRGDWIAGEASEGGATFTIPVPALNMPFDCAAYSKARQRWYDRQLLVDAASLPDEALAFDLPDYALIQEAVLAYAEDAPAAEAAQEAVPAPQPAAVNLADGEYSVEVNLAGGSGRASVSSPTLLTVRNGHAWAKLLWSSPYYDYMRIGPTRYENLTVDGGNSTYEIPVAAFDAPMSVVADTTAMGDPIEIDYALTFYFDTIADKGKIPQEAAKQVLVISGAIIAVGAVLNHFVKKRRR